jgi:hypothetical protein
MSRPISPDVVQPGQVIQFTYSRGSNPGNRRLVSVRRTDDQHVEGDDLTLDSDDHYRNFHKSAIVGNTPLVASENEEVIPVKRIFTQHALSTYTAQEISKVVGNLYADRKGARYDEDAQAIVVARNDLPKFEMTVAAGKVYFDFINADGKRLGLEFGTPATSGKATVPLPFHMSGQLSQADAENFAKQLAMHISSSVQPQTTTAGWSDFVVEQQNKGNAFYSCASGG